MAEKNTKKNAETGRTGYDREEEGLEIIGRAGNDREEDDQVVRWFQRAGYVISSLKRHARFSSRNATSILMSLCHLSTILHVKLDLPF